MNVGKNVLTKRIKPDGSTYAVAAGTSDLESDIVDTAGYEGVRFITGFGAITSGAVTSTKVQQNSANSGTGMADLEGSGVTVADTHDDKIVITEIRNPRERYLRTVIDRGTQNAVVDFMIVELFDPRVKPITEDASVIASEVFNSPAEGTA